MSGLCLLAHLEAKGAVPFKAPTQQTYEDENMSFPKEITWKGQSYSVPSLGELETMMLGDTAEAPDGTEVEPDHPDSWLSLLRIM